ncbi:hypothetical protein EUTSA_v10022311mg, partial [Eutrema salsugineum]
MANDNAQLVPVYNKTTPSDSLISVNMNGITKLTSSNYFTWKLQVYALFEAKHTNCITSSEKPIKRHRQPSQQTTSPRVIKKSSKIAFMFLTPGTLPFEKLWDLFFQGHEGKFSVYIHASKDTPVHTSRYFVNREIRSDEVVWGRISMIDAERRLLTNALRDPENQQFVLLSDSCVPLRSFEYMYNYMMYSNVSYVDCFDDPGPHGTGRHMDHMLPEIPKEDFRKGAQWFSMKRQHAVITMADSLYYSKFRDYCGPGIEGNKNCIADEHYLPTFFY